MAGGKLSPRQKMINMMYLVLLALLAMNISKEILDSFENLRVKLEFSAGTADQANVSFIDAMKEKIQEEIDNEGDRSNEGLKTDTLDMIRAETNKVIRAIDGHINQIEIMGQKDSLTGELKKKDELDRNKNYWMGEGDKEIANNKRGDGEAYKLHQLYDKYAKFIVDMHNSQLKTEEAQSQAMKLEDVILKDHTARVKEHNETWEVRNLKGPVVANLAFLEALKIDVYKLEKEVLDLLNTRLGVATFKVDKVVAINAPTATIVPAGLQFQTKLYVAMSSSQIKPRFSGTGVKADDGGNSATLTLGASGNVIPKGKKEGYQSYSATIQVPKATGGYETLNVSDKFLVRRPEVVITSATVQNLYRSCGNEINIDVPALGDFYTPKVTVSSGTINQSKKSKIKFNVVPTGRKCIVQVSSITNGQTIKIGDVAYNVIEPPKPTVQMLVNGRAYNGASPVPKTSRILVQILADKEFKASLPKDARYGVTTIDVLAQLSLGPPKRVNTVRGNSNAEAGVKVTMGTEVRQARPGTKVYVRINEIYRKNFLNKNIPDKRFSEVERTLSLVTK